MKIEKKVSLTVLLPAGHLPLDIMKEAYRLAEMYSLGIYLSTAQNLRLTDVPESKVPEVKNRLEALSVVFKSPGRFPLPRVCVGKRHCNLGIVDTAALSGRILDTFADRKQTKAKFKIAISACTLCCSNAKTTDIGIIATREGYEVFAGGKGGSFPQIGRRIGQKMSEETVLEYIETLVEFHDRNTEKKQRFYKLLSNPEFPFVEV